MTTMLNPGARGMFFQMGHYMIIGDERCMKAQPSFPASKVQRR